MCGKLWGCPEQCPFCKEPCQHSEPNHQNSHKCIQHRPTGMGGTRYKKTTLVLNTCQKNITSERSCNCQAHSLECRKSEHCTGKPDNTVFHKYKDYKKYLPKWDIAPDAADEACAYWKWAFCTFEGQLLEKYDATKLEIPPSWKNTSLEDALESLRKYKQ